MTADQIRARYKHYGDAKPNTAVSDIRALLEEIDRLNEVINRAAATLAEVTR